MKTENLNTFPLKIEEMTVKQRRIFEAALEVFSDKGFDGASTAEIAQKAQTAEGTIFKHFKTKRGLFDSIVMPFIYNVGLPLNFYRVGAVIDKEYSSYREFAKAVMCERLSFVKEHRKVFKMFIQEVLLHEELQQKLISNFKEKIFPQVIIQIEKAKQSGELKDLPPQLILRSTISLFAGCILPRLLFAADLPMDDDHEIESTLNVLMSGISKPSGAEK